MLALPGSGTIVCRMLPVTPNDSAAFVMETSEAWNEAAERQARFTFDSSGAPVFMVVVVSSSKPGERVTADAVRVRFAADPHGFHMRFEQDPAGGAHVVIDTTTQRKEVHGPRALPAGATASDSTELADARTLAAWAWVHRCKAAPVDQPNQ